MLAAGKGTRLWPLTETRPKPLVPVRGEPMLARMLRQLAQAGIEHATVVVADAKGPVARYLDAPESTERALDTETVVQAERRGTGHAAQMVDLPEDEPVVMAYGDLFLPDGAVTELIQAGPEGCIGAREVEDASSYGALELDEHGLLAGIAEKSPDPPSNLVNAGVYVLPAGIREHVHALEESPRGELELTDALTAAVQAGAKVHVHTFDAWMDVAWPWDLLAANALALEEMVKQQQPEVLGDVHEDAILQGPVHVEPGAEIGPGAVVKGPVWIGANATVGPNAYVRPATTLGPASKVGHGCEVKNSVLMEGAKVPHVSYVGDSVLGRDVNLGAGTQVANLRHDDRNIHAITPRGRIDTGRRKLGVILGDGVKTGINATLNCGVVLGPGEGVMPGEVVLRSRVERSGWG